MIHESSYWKDDLLKLANRLELRLIQTRWGDKNFYTIEKEIFIGFYSIRKLIESKKISDSIKSKLYELKEFPYEGSHGSTIDPYKLKDYSFNKSKISKISIASLCNQFIHSYHFVPFIPNGKNLIGFFFCSDYKRATGLYLINLLDIINIFRVVGENYPSSMHVTRNPNGKIITKIE
ncbi:hypothetical protein WH292_19890 [Enterobacter sp. MYb186]